jgi:hypothetical protein
MMQLAREGRLKPEAVAKLVRDGKLDADIIVKLRKAKIYSRKCLSGREGVEQIISKRPIGMCKHKVKYSTIRIYRYKF